MKHWLQLVAIPNSASSSSSQEMQAMKKRISDLEKARSRSPRRKDSWIPGGPSMLAVLAPSAPIQGSKVGTGGNNKKKGKGKGKSGSPSSAPSGTKDVNYMTKLPVDFRSNSHERFHKKEFCCAFQKGTCRNGLNCKFARICVGCGGSKPCDECRCLTSKIH